MIEEDVIKSLLSESVSRYLMDVEVETALTENGMDIHVMGSIWTLRMNAVHVPATWWDWFKLRWALAWFLNRFPLQAKSFAARATYPKFRRVVPKNENHMRWVTSKMPSLSRRVPRDDWGNVPVTTITLEKQVIGMNYLLSKEYLLRTGYVINDEMYELSRMEHQVKNWIETFLYVHDANISYYLDWKEAFKARWFRGYKPKMAKWSAHNLPVFEGPDPAMYWKVQFEGITDLWIPSYFYPGGN